MRVQRLGTVEWYTVTIRCMLVAWAWPAVLELYDSMPGVCMWGIIEGQGGVFRVVPMRVGSFPIGRPE